MDALKLYTSLSVSFVKRPPQSCAIVLFLVSSLFLVLLVLLLLRVSVTYFFSIAKWLVGIHLKAIQKVREEKEDVLGLSFGTL